MIDNTVDHEVQYALSQRENFTCPVREIINYTIQIVGCDGKNRENPGHHTCSSEIGKDFFDMKCIGISDSKGDNYTIFNDKMYDALMTLKDDTVNNKAIYFDKQNISNLFYF